MKLDHLIYGTFPDLPGSQQVVFKSSGISSGLQDWLINFYDGFGDCKNEEFKSSLSVCWFNDAASKSHAVITKVSHHGKDFSGRWGALLRHSAILTAEQYQTLGFDPSRVESHLVSSGTSEELANAVDLEVADIASADLRAEHLIALTLGDYRENLAALLRGEQLALYAENNNDISNSYLRNLVSLLPAEYRAILNWSEFVFRTSELYDIALVYSSRYEVPSSTPLRFTAVGENRLKQLSQPERFAEMYLSKLEQAFTEGDASILKSL
jgi:hypothetical protein